MCFFRALSLTYFDVSYIYVTAHGRKGFIKAVNVVIIIFLKLNILSLMFLPMFIIIIIFNYLWSNIN